VIVVVVIAIVVVAVGLVLTNNPTIIAAIAILQRSPARTYRTAHKCEQEQQ
jgi:hypothetical protein